MTTPAQNSIEMAAGQSPAATKSRALAAAAEVRNARMAQNFSQAVAVLMRDANFKSLKLGDLEWLVLPAIVSGQFKIAHASSQLGTAKDKNGGAFIPVALALWARVSDQVDRLLSENLKVPARLQPHQWTSGNIPWLLIAAGDKRAVPTFLNQLAEKEFSGQVVKLRARSSDGTIAITTLGAYARSRASDGFASGRTTALETSAS